MNRILEKLEDPQSIADHSKIIKHLKNFVYDTQSMTMLCQRESFINFVIFEIQSFLKDPENIIECSIKYKFSSEEDPMVLEEFNCEEIESYNSEIDVRLKNFLLYFF